MPQLLLELFSEEIPARMQAQAARDLERMFRERLADQGLLPEALTSFAGPRRLTLVAEGLPAAQGDRSEERKGPRVGAPDAAVEGFLRSTGLSRDQLVERDGVYFAVIQRKGRQTSEIIAETVEQIVRNFPWPKSMTWGRGTLRWVRPLKRILCVFNGEIVPFSIDGIESGDVSEGHRFMGDAQPFRARDFEAYADGLQKHFVVLDPDDRKARILEQARTLCFARNLELVDDQGLLDEVAGLAEWPTPILGDMDPAFLELPPEVIRTSMRTHQKYFAVRDPASGKLAPHFVTVANIQAPDGGAAIAAGNARVLSARLSDARFFWTEDRKVRLEDRVAKLTGVTFHAKLGTLHERVERLEMLARDIAPMVGADEKKAVLAARLAKADLATGMVGEFPELQGVMGGYYARHDGLTEDIAFAIEDHYKPRFAGDELPRGEVGTVVALADKLETLVGLFGIGALPTGDRDPFALRRHALGVIRMLIEQTLPLDLSATVAAAARHFGTRLPEPDASNAQLLAFMYERVAGVLREQGDGQASAQEADAVIAARPMWGEMPKLLAAVRAFAKLPEAPALAAANKRIGNILKKADLAPGAVDPALLHESAEQALHAAMQAVLPQADAQFAAGDYTASLQTLAALRAPVDAFFDGVMVNADDAALKANRLALLHQLHQAMNRVADISRLAA